MPRRFPAFPLLVAVVAGLFALTSALPAQPPVQPQPNGPQQPNPGNIRNAEKKNLEEYKELTDQLFKLAERWKNSPDPADRARAAIIEEALKKSEKDGVKTLFEEIIKGLDGSATPDSGELAKLIQKDKELNKAIQEIIDILESDDALTRLQKDIATLENQIKEIKQLKLEQENHNALNLRPNSDPEKQAKTQSDLTKRTQDLADKLGGKKDDPKNGNPNENQPNKENQPKAEPKGGDNASENKADNQDAKGGEPKDPMGGMNDPKAPSESKPTPKDGMNPDAGSKPMPKEGDPKNAGEAKPNAADPKPKSGDPKPMESGSKPQNDMKGGDKPSEPQAGGEPKPSPNSPMSPMSPSQSQQGNSKSNPSESKPNENNAQQQPKDPAQKNLQEAVPEQKGAEQDLKNNDKNSASKKEEKAIDKFEKALEELEKRLKQLREKEQAKKLEDLENRIDAMLKKQRAVRAATKSIDDGMKARKVTTPETSDVQKSQAQANIEAELVKDADAAINLLKGEGSAVVFAGVLIEVKGDMESVRDRLNRGNVGEDTVYIEDQIIANLERMLEAVKKQRKNLNKPPPPPMDGPPPPQGESQKELVELVEQLKLLRELQVQVNDRTKKFGERVKDSQQATDPDLQADLKKLGDRQKTLQKMLHDLATKANK